MALRIRREQGLLLVTLLLAAWIWSGSTGTYLAPPIRPKALDYTPPPAGGAAIASPASEVKQPRELFREPSETEPLPPRPLPAPELGPLPVVAPPLDPGPHPAHYTALRVPGGVVEQFQFGDGTAEAAPPAPAEATASNGAGATQDPQPAGDPLETWDVVETTSGKLYGRIRNAEKYKLHGHKGPLVQSLFLDSHDWKTGRLWRPNDEIKGETIVSIQLARTLRNEVELRKLNLGDGAASLPGRLQFVDWLLANAADAGWVFDEAEKQADRYIEISEGAVRGYRLKGYVLARRGDLGRQLEFYDTVPEALRNASFRHVGRGRILATLGLMDEAEQEFRTAVANDPIDALALGALANHLVRTRRAEEAVPFIEAARRNSQLAMETANGRWELARVTVAVMLAVGRPDEAERALGLLPEGEEFTAHRAFLKGSVAYARGDFAGAAASFQNAVGFGMASVGIGVAQTMDKKWVEARATLTAAADRWPLVRHRALSALGFLYARTGNWADAISALEHALSVDPSDVYSHYLLAHARRQAGQPEAAVDAVRTALHQSDDLAEAMGEAVLARLAVAERSPEDAPLALYAATKYADRLVELDTTRGKDVRYRELQGLAHARASDWKGARRAFQAGAELSKSQWCEIGIGLADYAQNQVEEARARFDEIGKRLPLGDPLREWCEQTIALIDDHSGKVQIRDDFARDELGNQWTVQPSGPVGPRLEQQQLRLEGRLAGTVREAHARRTLEESGLFLGTEVRVKLGSSHADGFAGLQLVSTTAGGARTGANEVQIRFGYQDRKPFLQITDGVQGRDAKDEERQRFEPVVLGITVDPNEPQMLGLHVDVNPQNKRFVLRATWNGTVVHERELQRLSRNSRTALHVDLAVDGRSGSAVDVVFDDFRLVRRQQQ